MNKNFVMFVGLFQMRREKEINGIKDHKKVNYFIIRNLLTFYGNKTMILPSKGSFPHKS